MALKSNSYKFCTNCVKYRAIIIQLRVLFLRIWNDYVTFNLKDIENIVILFLRFILYRNNPFKQKQHKRSSENRFYRFLDDLFILYIASWPKLRARQPSAFIHDTEVWSCTFYLFINKKGEFKPVLFSVSLPCPDLILIYPI